MFITHQCLSLLVFWQSSAISGYSKEFHFPCVTTNTFFFLDEEKKTPLIAAHSCAAAIKIVKQPIIDHIVICVNAHYLSFSINCINHTRQEDTDVFHCSLSLCVALCKWLEVVDKVMVRLLAWKMGNFPHLWSEAYYMLIGCKWPSDCLSYLGDEFSSGFYTFWFCVSECLYLYNASTCFCSPRSCPHCKLSTNENVLS